MHRNFLAIVFLVFATTSCNFAGPSNQEASESSPDAILRGHTESVSSLTFSPTRNLLVSGGRDHSIRLWNLDVAGGDQDVLIGHTGVILDVDVSPDGTTLASVSDDGTIRLWDMSNTGSSPIILTLQAEAGTFDSVEFSPDGQTLASFNAGENTITLWDLADSAIAPMNIKLRNPPDSASAGFNDAVFSPDWQKLVTCSNHEITLRDSSDLTATGVNLLLNSRQIISCEISPDGRTLASSAGATEGRGGVIHLWNLDSLGEPPRQLAGHTNLIFSVIISPLGKILASWDTDGRLIIWDTERADPVAAVLEGPGRTLAISPDGRYLASSSYLVSAEASNPIHIWDLTKLLRRGSQ